MKIEIEQSDYDRLKQVEEAAIFVTEAVQETASGGKLAAYYSAGEWLHQLLAATPEAARQEAQRQREYVQALEAVAEASETALSVGQVVGASKKLLAGFLAKLEAIRKKKP